MITLADFHERHSARWDTRGSRSHVVDYGDAAKEAALARTGCGLVDRSSRGKLRLTGTDRIAFTQGMVTNDVKKLGVGTGCYAAILTPKGKMISDCRILVRLDHLLLDVEPERAAVVHEFLSSHVISEDVEVAEVSAELAILTLCGPRAAEALGALSPELDGLAVSLEEHGHRDIRLLGVNAVLVAAPLGAIAGYDLILPMAGAGEVASSLADKASTRGLIPLGFTALESLRIEEGVPRYGPDMDQETIPLEAGIGERAISFDKGCYVGQEIVARIAHRGHVNRELVNLRFEGGAPRPGDKLSPDGEAAGPIGAVTSVAGQPGGGWLGMGYVRLESAKEGTRLKAGSGTAVIVSRVSARPPNRSDRTSS